MKEQISFDTKLRNKIKETVEVLSKAVKSTLGPSGTNVGVLSEIQLPIITNDGVTVAKSIKFEDPLKRYIYNILKTVSQHTDSVAGDGTTTANTLAEAIILEGIKNIDAGFSQIGISKGIRKATLLVLEELQKKSISVIDNKKLLLQVASISANNDSELGKIISEAFLKVGIDGQIEIKNSDSDKTYIDIVNGMKYNSGYESNMFVNTTKSEVYLEECSILLYEGKLKTIDPIIPALQEIRNNNTSLFIIADDYSIETINDLAHHKINNKVKVCAVKSPGYGIAKETNMEDLSLVTGAEIISKRFGLVIENFEMSQLGFSSTVKVDLESFAVINEKTDKKKIAKKIKELKEELKKEKTSFIKEEISDRIAKLSNGVAVMFVSGDSPVEITEKKYRIEDAINATRASLEEGIIPGGGITLLRIGEGIEVPKLRNRDQEIGFNILLKALKSPIKTICENAGENGDVIINEVLRKKSFNYGYDAKNKVYKDMIKGGIVDPFKVTKAALTNASSVSQMLLTMNCVIY